MAYRGAKPFDVPGLNKTLKVLDLARKKRKVHIVCTYEERHFREATNKRLDLVKLIFGECSLLDSKTAYRSAECIYYPIVQYIMVSECASEDCPIFDPSSNRLRDDDVILRNISTKHFPIIQ